MSAPAIELLEALRLEDGRRWGEAAERFQHDDAEAILGDAGERMHFLTRPRGGSKTTDLAGVALAAVVFQLEPGAQGYAVAADSDQAALLIDAAAAFVMRTPGLASRVTVERRRIVSRRSGAAVNVLPADGASAFGLLSPLFIVDEVAQWASTPNARRVWEAVISAVPKVPGCRLVVLTSAGEPSHWSHKVLELAKDSPRWRVHEVPGPLPWIPEETLEEQRRLLLPSQYRRLHENVWTEAEDRLTTLDDVRACVHAGTPPVVPGERYVIGVDLGLKYDRAVAAVCHLDREADTSSVVLDRMQVWTPTKAKPVDLAEVEAWLLIAHHEYGRAELVTDIWQAAAMVQRLRAKNVRVTEFTFSQASVGQLALVLFRLLRDHQLDLPDDEELIDELANVRLREVSPGVYRMDHDADRHDDRAIALALAAKHLLDGPASRRRARFRHAGNNYGRDWNKPATPQAEDLREESPREAARRARDAAFAALTEGAVWRDH